MNKNALYAGILGFGLLYSAESGLADRLSQGQLYADGLRRGTDIAGSVIDVGRVGIDRVGRTIDNVRDLKLDTLRNVVINPNPVSATKGLGVLALLGAVGLGIAGIARGRR